MNGNICNTSLSIGLKLERRLNTRIRVTFIESIILTYITEQKSFYPYRRFSRKCSSGQVDCSLEKALESVLLRNLRKWKKFSFFWTSCSLRIVKCSFHNTKFFRKTAGIHKSFLKTIPWFCWLLKVTFLQSSFVRFCYQGLSRQPNTSEGQFKNKTLKAGNAYKLHVGPFYMQTAGTVTNICG